MFELFNITIQLFSNKICLIYKSITLRDLSDYNYRTYDLVCEKAFFLIASVSLILTTTTDWFSNDNALTGCKRP